MASGGVWAIGSGGGAGGRGALVLGTCQFLRDEGAPVQGGAGAGEVPMAGISLPPVTPMAAGLRCGISSSGGGAIGCWVQGASASNTAFGVGYRWAGSFAIIRSMIATNAAGASGRIDRIGFGWRVWCQISF